MARSCLRRWYVFLPLLLIATWFSYSVYSSVKPVYYSQAVIGISPPSTRVANPASGVEVPRNGLLDIGGAPLIANMVSTMLLDSSVVDRVVAAGGVPDYNSRMFPGPANMGQLPLIMIEATTADPAAAHKTLELVIAQAEPAFISLQQQGRVPEEQMVAPFVVSPPSAPTAGMPARTRSTVAIFVVGAGLSVLLTVVVDVLLSRRKSRARQRGPEAETQPADHKRKEHEVAELNHRPEDTSAEPSILRGGNGQPDTLSVSVAELNHRPVDTSAEPSIRHGGNGLPDTLSVSVADLISWAQAQSKTTGPNVVDPPHHPAEPSRAAPAGEGAMDAT